jgi:hypothetical protein
MHKVYLTRSNDEIPEITIDGVQNRFGQIYRSLQTIETEDRTAGISEDRVQRYHYISAIDRSVNSTYINEETGRRNRTLPSGATVYFGALKWHFTRLHAGEESGPHAGYPRDCIEEIDHYTDGLKRYYSHMESIATYGNGEEYDSRLNWELRKLFALGRLGNFYPLLLTLWDEYRRNHLTAGEMQELLQLIEIASFRIYSIADRRSDTGESRFYRIANDIATGDKDTEWIASELKDAITSLEFDFAESLRDTNAYHRFAYKDIRYLFFNYDLFLRAQGMGDVGSSIEKAVENAGNNYTIEHIWPQDTSQLDLTEGEERIHEEIVHSLGNLTLVTGKRGSSWRNLPYSVKRERIEENRQDYLNSDFPMTRELAREYETWGEQVVESRMDNLVEYAEKRWSLEAEKRKPYASIRPSEISDNH